MNIVLMAIKIYTLNEAKSFQESIYKSYNLHHKSRGLVIKN